MFKPKTAGSLASKIAHTSTLPALGNKDLKLLQDVITHEKVVLTTLQKLAVDFSKASESLKSWGLGEGEDLGDVLSHATNIYAHISTALNNFANHEHTVRAHLKAVRSREEKLDETKRKRKSVAAKAEAADKKLSKMSGENKNLPAQTDILNKLRDEIRQLDTEIMIEEAKLGDFKRLSARNFMALKLGGLLEFGEKATIVGELGKLLIEEIPLDPTPPGQPRAIYQSHPKTENLDAEVSRCIGEVVFTAPPDINENSATYMPPPQDPHAHSRGSEDVPSPADNGAYPPPSSAAPAYTSLPTAGYGSPPEPRSKTLNDLGSPLQQESAGEFGEAGHRRFGSGPIRIGDDGQRIGVSSGGGGQFSTFPVKARTPGGVGVATGAGATGQGQDPSFSSSVASALGDSEIGASVGSGTAYPEEDEPRSGVRPIVNVGDNPWNGDDYGRPAGHARNESQETSHSPYAAGDQGLGPHRGDSRDAEKGVRFRTPSMEVSGMGPVAPGVASPMYPSAGWGGRSYDAPASPVRPDQEEPYVPTSYDDEFARNAAAAREVAREMDALQFAPPGPPPPLQQHRPPSPQLASTNLPSTRPLSIARTPSPLAPPNAPFAQPRSISPNPPVPASGSPRGDSPVNTIPPRSISAFSPTTERGDGPTPYGTPPEYPATASTTNLSSGGPPSAPRTISAAAFKRAGRMGSDAEMGKKRTLPSSPYPVRAPGPGAASQSQDNLSRGGGVPQLPPGAQPPDYFPAQREPGSPVASDYGSLGNVRVTNAEGTNSPGYSQNKFVTNLEE